MEPKKKLTSFFSLFILLCSLAGCNPKLKEIAKSNNNSIEKKFLDYPKYIEVDSILINKNIPFYGKMNDLPGRYKFPDSINDYGYECGSALETSNKIYFFNETEIEVSDSDYFFRKISFNIDTLEIRNNRVQFNYEYTLDNFQKDFPESYKTNRNTRNDVTEIFVSTNKEMDYDVTWRFYFFEGKLIKLWYFISC